MARKTTTLSCLFLLSILSLAQGQEKEPSISKQEVNELIYLLGDLENLNKENIADRFRYIMIIRRDSCEDKNHTSVSEALDKGDEYFVVLSQSPGQGKMTSRSTVQFYWTGQVQQFHIYNKRFGEKAVNFTGTTPTLVVYSQEKAQILTAIFSIVPTKGV